MRKGGPGTDGSALEESLEQLARMPVQREAVRHQEVQAVGAGDQQPPFPDTPDVFLALEDGFGGPGTDGSALEESLEQLARMPVQREAVRHQEVQAVGAGDQQPPFPDTPDVF